MADTVVTGTPFAYDKLLAGDFPKSTALLTVKTGQGALPRGTALGQSYLTAGAAVPGTHTGTETVGAVTVLANARPGVYTLECVAVDTGVGTFAVFNPEGERLADAVQAVAYADQIGFTIAGGGSEEDDTYSVTVTDARLGLQVSDIAAGENGGGATLAAATIQAGAIAGRYVIKCTVVDGDTSTFEVDGPAGFVANATQGTPFATQIGFTIAGDAPELGDEFIVTVAQGVVENVVCNKTAADGSAKLYAITAEDCDTTDGDVPCPVYLSGQFNQDAVKFATGDSYVNHLNDKATLFLTPIHP